MKIEYDVITLLFIAENGDMHSLFREIQLCKYNSTFFRIYIYIYIENFKCFILCTVSGF